MSNDPSFDHVQALLRLKRYERPAEGHEALAEQTVKAFYQRALHRACTITLSQLLREKWQALRPLTAISLIATPVLTIGLLAWSLKQADRTTASTPPKGTHSAAVELISSNPILSPNGKTAPAVQNASQQKNEPLVKKPSTPHPATETTQEDGNIIIVR